MINIKRLAILGIKVIVLIDFFYLVLYTLTNYFREISDLTDNYPVYSTYILFLLFFLTQKDNKTDKIFGLIVIHLLFLPIRHFNFIFDYSNIISSTADVGMGFGYWVIVDSFYKVIPNYFIFISIIVVVLIKSVIYKEYKNNKVIFFQKSYSLFVLFACTIFFLIFLYYLIPIYSNY